MVIDLANAAYEAAMRGDDHAAEVRVRAIAKRSGLNLAMLCWVDRTIVTLGIHVGAVNGLVLEADGTAEQFTVDQALPEVRWAARMYAARVAGDSDTWRALVQSIRDYDADTTWRHIMALLNVMAQTVVAAEDDKPVSRRRALAELPEWVNPDPLNTKLAATRIAVAHWN